MTSPGKEGNGRVGRDRAVAGEASTDAAEQVLLEAERPARSGERRASAASRVLTALERAREAVRRDEAARRRDLIAHARDRSAEARDRAAERKETAVEVGAAPDTAIAALKGAAASARAKSTADRARAAADRERAAADRARAASDRRQSRIDLHRAYLDDLTGVYTRGLGLLMLQHELERAHRSGEPFVLAFVDIDGLKQVNDRLGQAAGDALLRAVAAELRSKLRPYDPIVRMGGDEFVCAFTDTGLQAANDRMGQIQAALGDEGSENSISVGLAELSPGQDLDDLIARGDAELYRVRGSR